MKKNKFDIPELFDFEIEIDFENKKIKSFLLHDKIKKEIDISHYPGLIERIREKISCGRKEVAEKFDSLFL